MRLRARSRDVGTFIGAIVLLVVAAAAAPGLVAQAPGQGRVPPDQVPLGGAPMFELDPAWPKPLPNNWMLGAVYGVAVDSRDHVWVIQNQKGMLTSTNNGMRIAAAGKQMAPPVLEYDAEGKVVRAWGGPQPVPPFVDGKPWKPAPYTWMEGVVGQIPVGNDAEHGIHVDHKDNVWVAGNGHVVLKFTREGKFLLQLGELWKTSGSNDTRFLGSPTDIAVDAASNQVFVADGYMNRRIIAFDADTGVYKRHWGAYGNRPDDDPIYPNLIFDPEGPLPQKYGSVHCVVVSKDSLVYVCDRERNRVQIFKPDGTFVNELFVARNTPTPGPGRGSVSSLDFSPDPQQRYLYVGDSTTGNRILWIFRRSDLRLLGSLDLREAKIPTVHAIAVDSKGNIYTVGNTDGVRKLQLKGGLASSTR